ncbi:MAG: TlpA disulfide reductase family protein [Actinomycetota bacterium]
MNVSKRLISLGFALSLLLVGCGGGASSNGSESFIAGNGAVTFINSGSRIMAPRIEGSTLGGGTFQLAPGQVAVVNVWASWCAPCRAEAPTLAALSKKFPDVSFVGILTRDNPAAASAFVKRFAIGYPTLTDDAILIGFHASLIANAIPTTIIVDKHGRVAARISGEVTVASLTDLIERVIAE